MPAHKLGFRALGPFENGGPHAVPGAALRAVPVPSDAMQAAIIALVPATSIAYTGEQGAQRHGIRRGIDARVKLTRHRWQTATILRREGGCKQPGELSPADTAVVLQTASNLTQHIPLANQFGQ